MLCAVCLAAQMKIEVEKLQAAYEFLKASAENRIGALNERLQVHLGENYRLRLKIQELEDNLSGNRGS
jgi:predicted nuclease with TOPRIM domain